MNTLIIIITAYLRELVTSEWPHQREIYLARWLLDAMGEETPNWIRMLAGASDECITNPDLFAALIDEVRSAMED